MPRARRVLPKTVFARDKNGVVNYIDWNYVSELINQKYYRKRIARNLLKIDLFKDFSFRDFKDMRLSSHSAPTLELKKTNVTLCFDAYRDNDSNYIGRVSILEIKTYAPILDFKLIGIRYSKNSYLNTRYVDLEAIYEQAGNSSTEQTQKNL